MLRSASLRLAALYTAAFALSVVILGVITLQGTRQTLSQQFDTRIQTEATALADEFQTEGLKGVVEAVEERDRTHHALHYGIASPSGVPLAGRFAVLKTPPGWTTMTLARRRGGTEPTRLLTTVLPGGYRLVIGDDDDESATIQKTVAQGFTWAFAGVVALGILGGYGLSHTVHRRLAAMTGAAEAIIDGDMGRRIPVSGSDDELDRLAATFNRMLERISTLMDSLRQVSNDIAHDLRTPLTRLRQRLEASQSLTVDGERAEAVAGALDDVDAILETFAALLRIAQIEGGARRAAFRTVDLTALSRTVAEAFAPSAEDGGQAIRFEEGEPAMIEGDPELLTQMMANLIENALRHGGDGAQVRVRAMRQGADIVVVVADNGPGIPPAEREKVFDRFYRLEQSRSTPGSGLGLALVAAVARLHGASVSLSDAGPGLAVSAAFRPRTKSAS